MSASSTALAGLGNIRQLGYVVENIDRSIAAWTAQLAVGPWLIIRNVPLQTTSRGLPSVPLIDCAFAYRGEIQIELIQQKNDAASPYRAWIEQGRYGLHHTAFLVEQIGQRVEQLQHAGLTMACDINMPTGGRYVYFDSPVPGEQTSIELLEATPAMMQMFEQGMAGAAAWDGSGQPVVIDFAAMTRSARS